MRDGVGHRDTAAVREAEQVQLLDAEVLPQRLDVRDVGPERVVVGRVRSVRASRAEEHELERVVEPGEVLELGAPTRPGRPDGKQGADRSRAARTKASNRPAW